MASVTQDPYLHCVMNFRKANVAGVDMPNG
jgi:hypothetical protein